MHHDQAAEQPTVCPASQIRKMIAVTQAPRKLIWFSLEPVAPAGMTEVAAQLRTRYISYELIVVLLHVTKFTVFPSWYLLIP